MKTSSCKAKGRRASQEAKDQILKHIPELGQDDIMVTPSGVTGPDLFLSPKAQELFPYTVECKNVEALNIWKALEQAESHIRKNEKLSPLLVFTRNRTRMYVALPIEDFLKLKVTNVPS